MSILDTIRRFFSSPPDPDHPLSEEEREGVPQTTQEEAAGLIDEFIDPDEPR
jgi:hypothetical protein